MFKVCSVVCVASAAAWDLPGDCRNQTFVEQGGVLPTLSWHIHYTTDKVSSEPELDTFYEAFVAQFRDKMLSDDIACPFGPNFIAYSSDIFPSQTMCSFGTYGDALEFDILAPRVGVEGSPWGSLKQRAFHIPIELIDEAWEWSKENRGTLDIIKHPNTGCQHDDHDLRQVWDGTAHLIATLEFPCNVPATGCNEKVCGCADADLPHVDDAPEHSCPHCEVMGELPPDLFLA